MANLKSIRKRIVTVKNTRQITKAMKMVAAAKLRRAQENVFAARPYASRLAQVLQRLNVAGEDSCHPLAAPRDRYERVLLVAISSDRGLCGGFNAGICKAAEAFMRDNADTFGEISLVTIGRKAHEYLRRRTTVRKCYTHIMTPVRYQTAAEISQEFIGEYLSGEYDAVFLLYNAFKGLLGQNVALEQLLPVEVGQVGDDDAHPDTIYEPGQEALLAELLPKHIEMQLFRAMLESVAAEHGARMTAMDSATKNATDMMAKLTLQYNRARQAVITTELMEIISGAESING